ncbi:ubiquitin domain-containing protein DSK2b-like [Forsythia ovata]|uniref:Ubiquitin domain-containing protein DSK2b-like n=1 Tax=Forsythia ovata TaxID=205694 RepID=A0ABD1VII3_9LAMI
MLDPSSFSQFLQNLAMTQMMQSLFSNPQHMDQILGFNPQLRSMLDMNPQMREMMQNPEILRQLTSPETIQQMMALHKQLSQLGQQQSTPERTQANQVQLRQNYPSFVLQVVLWK